MKYSKQIRTKIISTECMWGQLRFILSRLEKHGLLDVKILFGCAWGNYIYPGPQWEYEKLSLDQIEPRIKKEEDSENGKLSDDDFYIQLSEISLEIQLCHESDLHLWFEKRSPLVEEFIADWKALGFEPKEYFRENDKWIELIK